MSGAVAPPGRTPLLARHHDHQQPVSTTPKRGIRDFFDTPRDQLDRSHARRLTIATHRGE